MLRHHWAATALCALAAFFVHGSAAQAVTLAKLKGGGAHLQLCPKPSCPAVSDTSAGSGGMIPIFEFSGAYARVGPYMTREAAAARFSPVDAASLPDKPALWIARALISTGDADADLAALRVDEQLAKQPENQSAEKPRVARPPVPEPSPRKRITAVEPAPSETPAPAVTPAAFPQMPVASAQLMTSAPSLSPAPLKTEPAKAVPQEAPPAAEPVAAPAAAVMTPELMDKRLKTLPAKANADYTLEQVVALRRQALAFLTDGSCASITEGGATLTPGFLYLICDDDGAWRLFPQ